MQVWYLNYKQKLDEQDWELVIEKTPYQESLLKKCSDMGFENRKYLNSLQDLSTTECTKG